MISPFKFSFAILITTMLLLASGCDHRSTTTVTRYSFADSVIVDSLTLWSEHMGTDHGVVTAYVMDSIAAVYVLRDDRLYLDTIIRLTDSMHVTKDLFEQYFSERFYPVQYGGRQGFIRGTSLGFGLPGDFDNDGRSDLILYGYSRYQRDTTGENPENPLTIKFISATGAISELYDTTSSDLELKEVPNVRLSKKLHVYELSAGYPACGYPQYHLIIAYGNGKGSVIHRAVTSTDSGMGDYCQFYYPSDNAHHVDTIYISHRQSLPLSDESDSLVTSTLDSTILYFHEGSWGAHNYRLDPKSN